MKHSDLRGRDLHSPSNELVENNSGATLPKLTAVTFDGMGSVYPQIVRGSGPVDIIRGITQTDLATGKTGYITSLGFLSEVDTSAWAVGTKLYADTSGNLGTTPSGLPVATVLKQSLTAGVLYVDNTGVTKGDLNELQFPDPLSLEIEWSILYPNFFTEPTYDMSNRIDRVDLWDSPSKVVHIFSKVFTYSGSQITKVVLTREYDGQVLQKDITYNLAGFVQNVTRTYTP